ncbi:peptide deformylase [Streptomyces sp. NPDC057638]|uniref:peptide deformylase n=1 Tax=Streptomyces sp. NPDC057638 TaxID=3346190 RepID=UPI0036AC9072
MSENRARASVDQRVRVQGEPVDSYPELSPGALDGQVRRITVVGEEILHKPCADVVEFGTAELSALIDDMFLTMNVADGAGLAANQVDVNLRLFVYDCYDEDGVRHVGHICNPVVEEPSGDDRRLIEQAEGCLSVPGAGHELARGARTVVHGVDKNGDPLVIEGTGYFARCLQHETDHLNGILYLDRLSSRQRRTVLKEMEDQRERVFAQREAKAAALGK